MCTNITEIGTCSDEGEIVTGRNNQLADRAYSKCDFLSHCAMFSQSEDFKAHRLVRLFVLLILVPCIMMHQWYGSCLAAAVGIFFICYR